MSVLFVRKTLSCDTDFQIEVPKTLASASGVWWLKPQSPNSSQLLSYCSKQLCNTSANKDNGVPESLTADEQLSGASRHGLLWETVITIKSIKSETQYRASAQGDQ